MILGMSIPAFTFLHVTISLIGIFSGDIAVVGLMKSKLLTRWTALFLITTALTSITGFLFPFNGVTPAIILGAISILVLLPATFALYVKNLAGAWRTTYIVTAILSLYFNVFVLVAQLFAKVPALKQIAPTQSSPAFGAAQLVVMVAFIVITIRAIKRFQLTPA